LFVLLAMVKTGLGNYDPMAPNTVTPHPLLTLRCILTGCALGLQVYRPLIHWLQLVSSK